MDFHLAREMDTLGSDVLLRRRNLQNLLSALTPHEIRDLGKYAAEVDFRTDIFGRLPMELRLEIAEYLDAADLFNFLNVSKTWRKAWSHSSMINLFMPGFVECHRQTDAMISSRQDLEGLFYKECQMYQARLRGDYRYGLAELAGRLPGDQPYSDTNFVVDTEYHQQTNPRSSTSPWPELIPPLAYSGFRELLYSHGRVVWQPVSHQLNNSLIVVDNLKSQLRKTYTIPEAVLRGGEAKLMAVGDRLVVASLERTLHAWDLETNEHCSLTLPSSTLSCKTYGKQVYLYPHILADNPGGAPVLQIYTWKFKGSLRELDTAPLLDAIGKPSQQPEEQLPWYCTGIIAHPLLDETIYVVCQLGCTVSLHKYVRAVHSACLSFTISEEEDCYINNYMSIRLSRLNSYGKYLISICRAAFRRQFYRIVSFDAIREAFSVEEYAEPRDEFSKGCSFTWWDSHMNYSPVDSWKEQLYLDITHDLKGARATKEQSISKELIPSKYTLFWTRCPIFESHLRVPPPGQYVQQLIFADDDFIVIRRAYGYLALSFRTKFKKFSRNAFQWSADEIKSPGASQGPDVRDGTRA